MEDVTDRALKGVGDEMPQAERDSMVKANAAGVIAKATAGTHYEAAVEPFYYGNQYFLFVYEKFRDVRLVAAPPSAIGKFGGDHDNWMWPPHTRRLFDVSHLCRPKTTTRRTIPKTTSPTVRAVRSRFRPQGSKREISRWSTAIRDARCSTSFRTRSTMRSTAATRPKSKCARCASRS